MAQYTRREWMKPAMVIFGSQLAYGKQADEKDKKPKLQGLAYSESIVRMDEDCGIRQAANCLPQNGSHCFTYMGPKCGVDQMGQPDGDDRNGQP